MRKQSQETQLRELKHALKVSLDREARLLSEITAYRARASKAEADAAEWKRRFDALLNHSAFVGKEQP